MGKKGFKDLIVWQKAKDLAVSVYGMTDNGSLSRDFGLRDQLRRSAVSIASNLAEGDDAIPIKNQSASFILPKDRLQNCAHRFKLHTRFATWRKMNTKASNPTARI